MGHYFFLKDLEESKVAVNVVKSYLSQLHKNVKGLEITELERARQKEGDLEVTFKRKASYCVEVKYDMMAKKTGNMCFETHNKKGDLTGIASTEADEIHYVVPRDEGFILYVFNTKSLRKYLYDEKNIGKFRMVKGGDRRATSMILVKIDVLLEDNVAHKIEEINAEL